MAKVAKLKFDITKKTINWGGKPLTIESGRIARQADGCVLVTYGDTQVLAAVVGAKADNPAQDFFPLTVHYQERFYAAGRVPGGFFKREARPTDYETLTSRLIDRPLRPMFHPDYQRETNVICTVVSHDGENQGDIIAMIAASAALTISGMPFMGPIAGARVGYKDGEYTLNPTYDELQESDLDLVLAGTASSVLMVESEAQQLSEEIMLGAVEYGHKEMQAVINLIIDFAENCAKEPWEIASPDHSELKEKLRKALGKDLSKAYAIKEKQDRVAAVKAAKDAALEKVGVADDEQNIAKGLLKKLEAEIVRGDILKNQTRIDGRDPQTVRPIECEIDILRRTHGSALFTRGETQALVVTTLGTGQDEQMIDAVTGESKEHFLLHYNFPPYSVGEVGRMGAPGRREIGHGKLGYRALRPLLPSKADFPYTIRVVSEITESNGSSSMATVCGGSMSMMNAGVPLKAPAAGIAMGLIKEGDDFVVLSDIMGDEDHLGDMDFKVAGTQEGITALQMDIKINGITFEIMKVALEQAKAGRLHILNEMSGTITGGGELNQNAPRIVSIKIDKDKIGAVIGPAGKVIKEIVATSGAKVDIEEMEDHGLVKIASSDPEAIAIAEKMVRDITAVAEVGKVYQGPIAKIMDFGAFVTFMGATDGLVHISEINDDRVESVTDVLEEGQTVYVKLVGTERGKYKLSMRVVNQETGEDLDPENAKFPERDEKPRGDRGGDRGRRDDRKKRA
jgi:polyribonucleotide nucleotidyltransferase